jgi:hypothetical protein
MDQRRTAGTTGNAQVSGEQALGSATAQVQGVVSKAQETVQDYYGQGRETVANAVSAAQETAGHASKAVIDTASDFETTLRDAIETRPYTAVALAFIAGWAIAKLGTGSRYS